MKISGGIVGGGLYIKLVGDMDEYTARDARAVCDRLIENNASADRIVIDLSEVAFMDSSGIGFLIGRYKKASRIKIPVYVQSPDAAADKILSLSGIYTLIPKAE